MVARINQGSTWLLALFQLLSYKPARTWTGVILWLERLALRFKLRKAPKLNVQSRWTLLAEDEVIAKFEREILDEISSDRSQIICAWLTRGPVPGESNDAPSATSQRSTFRPTTITMAQDELEEISGFKPKIWLEDGQEHEVGSASRHAYQEPLGRSVRKCTLGNEKPRRGCWPRSNGWNI